MSCCCLASCGDDGSLFDAHTQHEGEIKHLCRATGLHVCPRPMPIVSAPPPKTLVRLNVYHLIDEATNMRLMRIGCGVFHSGVIVYGIEWSFGESVEGQDTGLFCVAPGNAAGVVYKTLDLGFTDLSPEQVDTILHRLENEWRSGDYHVLDHNCNHFAERFCSLLSTLERLRVPAWCNRLARLGNRVIPQKLATWGLRQFADGDGPPMATTQSVRSNIGELPKSIIPANWYKVSSLRRPPRYQIRSIPHPPAPDREGPPTRQSTHKAARRPVAGSNSATPPPSPSHTANEIPPSPISSSHVPVEPPGKADASSPEMARSRPIRAKRAGTDEFDGILAPPVSRAARMPDFNSNRKQRSLGVVDRDNSNTGRAAAATPTTEDSDDMNNENKAWTDATANALLHSGATPPAHIRRIPVGTVKSSKTRTSPPRHSEVAAAPPPKPGSEQVVTALSLFSQENNVGHINVLPVACESQHGVALDDEGAFQMDIDVDGIAPADEPQEGGEQKSSRLDLFDIAALSAAEVHVSPVFATEPQQNAMASLPSPLASSSLHIMSGHVDVDELQARDIDVSPTLLLRMSSERRVELSVSQRTVDVDDVLCPSNNEPAGQRAEETQSAAPENPRDVEVKSDEAQSIVKLEGDDDPLSLGTDARDGPTGCAPQDDDSTVITAEVFEGERQLPHFPPSVERNPSGLGRTAMYLNMSVEEEEEESASSDAEQHPAQCGALATQDDMNSPTLMTGNQNTTEHHTVRGDVSRGGDGPDAGRAGHNNNNTNYNDLDDEEQFRFDMMAQQTASLTRPSAVASAFSTPSGSPHSPVETSTTGGGAVRTDDATVFTEAAVQPTGDC